VIISFTEFRDSNACSFFPPFNLGKGGKNRRRGKNENESEKRELVFKEDGQGEFLSTVWQCLCFQSDTISGVH